MSAAATTNSLSSGSTRPQRVERALFRGACLTVDNSTYAETVRHLIKNLLSSDLSPRDITVESLGLDGRQASSTILARENGVVAGLEEAALLMRDFGIEVKFAKQDGEAISDGTPLLILRGARGALLSLERTALNVIQRMSGIATATRRLDERARAANPGTRVVGTRKTPWGLLDKRALHLGSGGTHRIGLGDAILIKNNHLALMGNREDEAVKAALIRAWKFRNVAAFIEVEVRTEAGAIAAAESFRNLRGQDGASDYDCLLMLDNMDPSQIRKTLDDLQRLNLWDAVLVEASGGISSENIEGYASAGVDAVSVGALTHSPRALDISQNIS